MFFPHPLPGSAYLLLSLPSLPGMAYVTDPSGRFVASSELSTISVVTPKNGGIAIAITRMIVHTTTKCTINFKKFRHYSIPHFCFSGDINTFSDPHYTLFFFFRSTYNLDKKKRRTGIGLLSGRRFFSSFLLITQILLYTGHSRFFILSVCRKCDLFA